MRGYAPDPRHGRRLPDSRWPREFALAVGGGQYSGSDRDLPAPGRRPTVSLPGGRPPPPPGSIVTGFPEPVPIMTQRWPRTGSARKLASAVRMQARSRCSDAPRAVGHAPGSPKHGNHRKDPTRFLISEQPRTSWQLRGQPLPFLIAQVMTTEIVIHSGVIYTIPSVTVDETSSASCRWQAGLQRKPWPLPGGCSSAGGRAAGWRPTRGRPARPGRKARRRRLRQAGRRAPRAGRQISVTS